MPFNVQKHFLLFFLTISLTFFGQDSNKFSGVYKQESSTLIINPDNTFFIIDYGTVIKGKLAIENNQIKLVSNQPKYSFILCGRKRQARVTGNIIMFHNFENNETLINYNENNNKLQFMRPVFNSDVNCIDYPVVLDNTNNNPKFYFAVKGQNEIYEFKNNKGYNDFVVLYFPKMKELNLYLKYNKKENALMMEGEKLTKLNLDEESKKEYKEIISMYGRVNTKTEYYYCNPAYNIFEESGIDLNNYNKQVHGDEYFFVNKNTKQGDEKDYHNDGIIYEYKMIVPIVLKNKTFTIEETPVFNYNCHYD